MANAKDHKDQGDSPCSGEDHFQMKDDTEVSKILTGNNEEQLKQIVGFAFHFFVVAFIKINLHTRSLIRCQNQNA